MMMVQTPIVELLRAHGCTPERFAGIVRSRRLNGRCRDDRYDTGQSNGIPGRRRPLPTGFPDMAGMITWRKAGHWSLDVSMARIAPDIIFHGTYSKDVSTLRLSGVRLAETIVTTLTGSPLTRLVEHPFFMDQGILIREIRTYAESDLGGRHEPASIEVHLTVPRSEHRDACADHSGAA